LNGVHKGLLKEVRNHSYSFTGGYLTPIGPEKARFL